MAQKYRNVGGIESSDALASLTDGDGAYMDFDTGAGNAHFGAKGGAGANRGVLIRTLLAGAAVLAITITAAGAVALSDALTVAGQAAFVAQPGSLGGGGIGITITENESTNPVGQNGYVRVGRGQAMVTRNASNTGDHILVASNTALTDSTDFGDGDYITVLLGKFVNITGGNPALSPALGNPFLVFGDGALVVPGPALRSVVGTTTLDVRLSDDSAYANFRAAGATFDTVAVGASLTQTVAGNSLITSTSTVNGAVSEFVAIGKTSPGVAVQANMGLNRFADSVWSLSDGTNERLRVDFTNGVMTAYGPIGNTVGGSATITAQSTVNGAVAELIASGKNSTGTARQANMGLNRFADDVWSLSNGATEYLRVNLTTGVIRILALAGTGSRTVVASADGTLSAP